MGREPGKLTLSEDDRQVLAVWAADCADRTLSLFEAQAAGDTRPRDAIAGLRAFARGELRIGKARALSVGANAAARETGDRAAVAAARATGQVVATAHMAAHARGAAAYAAKAAGLAAPDDATAMASEVRWQCDQASPAVCEVLLRLPGLTGPAGMLAALITDPAPGNPRPPAHGGIRTATQTTGERCARTGPDFRRTDGRTGHGTYLSSQANPAGATLR